MQRKLIFPDLDAVPSDFRSLFIGSSVYDSSCSPAAKVYFIDKDNGYYLKSAPKGALKTEAELTAYFYKKHLATEVLSYISAEKDWMLTQRVCGEDCTHAAYLEDPEKLCDTIAELLRALHEADHTDCPVQNRIESYFATAERSYREKLYDASQFPDSFGYASAQEAWKVVEKYGHLLKADTLLYGDYCLPNIMLDKWRFSGFIDLGNGGVGDKHIDIFWGIWSLWFNLKTDRFQERFMDAYGRSAIEPEMLKVIAAFEVFG